MVEGGVTVCLIGAQSQCSSSSGPKANGPLQMLICNKTLVRHLWKCLHKDGYWYQFMSRWLSLFIFLRKMESTWERAEKKRETENPKQAPCCQHRARRGAWTHEPREHDLSRNQESDAWPTEPPGGPREHITLTEHAPHLEGLCRTLWDCPATCVEASHYTAD